VGLRRNRSRSSPNPVVTVYAFFTRKVGQLGFAKAIVAVARKILTIIWHLVVNDEEYEEQNGNRKQEVRIPKAKQPRFLTLDEMLKVLAEANIFLKQAEPQGVGNTSLVFSCEIPEAQRPLAGTSRLGAQQPGLRLRFRLDFM
jgi:hypothetical protein